MMYYLALIKKQKDKKFLVEFPGLPGCLTGGRTFEKALSNAKEALDGWLAAHCDRDLNIPMPHAGKKKGNGLHLIEGNVQIEFAIGLRQLRKKKGLTQTQVADKLNITQQAYAKLETPLKANPSLTTIQKLSKAFDVEGNFDWAA